MFDAFNDLAGVLRQHPYLHHVATLEEDANGFVQHVLDNRAENQNCLVKFIRRGHGVVTEKVRAEILNQLELCHPHVVQLKEIFLLREYLCILMELAPGGHLLDYIRLRGPLREGRARYYFQQLILAMDYCHQKSITNRVITLQNLCLSGDYSEILKLYDLTLSESEKRPSRLKSSTSTIAYMAPEAIKSHGNKKCDGKTADVWSCGVVLYAMVTGRLPFSPPASLIHQTKDVKVLNVSIARQILKVDYISPRGASSDLRHLLSKIFIEDPKDRITVEGIKEHPWFLKGLPSGALQMTSQWIHKTPPRKQSNDEIERILRKAMKDIKHSTEGHV